MTRPTPRRPASSRGTTPRPRKIAGQTPAAPAPAVEPAEAHDERRRVRLDKRVAGAVRRDPVPTPPSEEPAGDRPGFLARARTTNVLIIALAVTSVIMVALGSVVLLTSVNDDGPAVGDGGTPSGLPVVAAELDVIDGVESAAKAAQEIVAVNYEKYDDEVDQAAKLMTKGFEKQYRDTTADVEKDIVGQKTVVQANVVAQGVVSANRTRLQALVFLNQVVTRTREGKPETVVTPYKVLVTMVHTDKGWLVDDLDTDAPERDKDN